MAATTKITSGSGFRGLQLYALDTSGYPDGDQSGIDGYDGVNLEGANTLTLTLPQVRRVQHSGNDRLIAQDYLPPNEGGSGEVRTTKQNLDTDATLTGTKVQTLGEMQMGGMGTDKQGSEIDVAVLAYRQALDTEKGSSTFGLRRWQVKLLPKCRLVPRGGDATDGGGEEQMYDIIPSVTTAPPWGTAFGETDNGFTEAQVLPLTSDNPPVMERFDAIAGSTEYNLTHTPISTDKAYATLDGVAETVASVNTTTDTATITTSPSGGEVLVIIYETTDAIF